MRFCYSLTHRQVELIPKLESQHIGFEIRLDTFPEKPDFKKIRTRTKNPLLATFRSKMHLGQASMADRDAHGFAWRMEALDAGFEMIDVELDEPELNEKIARIHERGGKVVLSHHELVSGLDLDGPLSDCLATTADIIKIIGFGENALDFKHQRKRFQWVGGRRLVHFYMGAEHAATRALSLVYGSPFTFITPDASDSVAPGQLTLEQARDLYGLHDLSKDHFKLFGVIGAPIGHSRSPSFHNPPLKKKDAQALFVALPVKDTDDLAIMLETFPEWRGSAVTKPMKEIAYRVSDEWLDEDSSSLGAVNTLILGDNLISAANTDLLAVKEILKQHARGGLVRILGYGGLGKAVVRACASLDLKAEICNRTSGKIGELPDGVMEIAWEDRHGEGPSLIFQATSAGMAPRTDVSPLDRIPESVQCLVETIYNPSVTLLMKRAQEQGVTVVDGHTFFNLQAQIQNDFFVSCLDD